MDIVERINQEIKDNNNSLNIAIAGCTCSGKTTLANNLKEILSDHYSVTIMHQDDYYKDLDKIPKSKVGYLTDSINAFEVNEFKQDLNKLLTYGKTLIPKYDILNSKRINKNIEINKSEINIFEGLHVIQLLSDIDNLLTIFLNTPTWVCLERRVNRDVTIHKVSEKRIREYFDECIMPLTKAYVLPQANNAKIVLNEGSDEKCLLKKYVKN